MTSTAAELIAEARGLADEVPSNGYKPWDQGDWLGEQGWAGEPLKLWEAAHGHDARLNCDPEICALAEVPWAQLVRRLADALEAATKGPDWQQIAEDRSRQSQEWESAYSAVEPRVVSTVAELDALPVHAVLRTTANGIVWEVVEDVTDGTEERYRSVEGQALCTGKAMAARGPFHVLHTPSVVKGKTEDAK